MIKIIIPLLILINTHAGVGGIAGGTEKFQKGSHINFQKVSTFVNVLFSRSLCHDNYEFEAMVNQCNLWVNDGDGKKCEEWIKVKAYQPIESKRSRCKRYEDDTCVEWIEVDFVQSPRKIVEIKDEDGNIKEIKRVIIPKCK
ncbi:MAG: hypothetical protein K9K67_10755 [Bacteriovoracaceae bacterium]|nr:hypothetical protein [Bacteriovoracaceae bacterium]